MCRVSPEKKGLLRAWIAAHAPGNSAPLFAAGAPSYQLTPEAVALLKRPSDGVEMKLYVVCLGEPEREAAVAYVGKSADPWARWSGGHLRNLRLAAKGAKRSAYARWVRLFESADKTVHLVCVGERGIGFPPIPRFPGNVGSVEYQLVSLAHDCYPEYLLNREGVAR